MKRVTFLMVPLLLVSFLGISPCFAAQYDLKTITPQVDQALKNRQGRFQQLQGLKQAGIIGENNKGYVTELKSDPGAAAVVVAENADRGVIYRALVDQNALGPNGMREVERAFSEVQNEKAVSGEMVQSPSGNWVRKSA